MAVTTTDICNLALSALSTANILSMEETSAQATSCRTFYEHTRRRLLRMFPWSFAQRDVKLAVLDTELPGSRYVYAYPAECFLVSYVYDEEHAKCMEERPQDFRVVAASDGRRGIATDVSEAWARYTADIKDPAMMSDEFIDAFYHLLASAMAMPLVDSASMMQTNYQLAQAAVQAAKWENMVESAKRTRYPHGYSDARFR